MIQGGGRVLLQVGGCTRESFQALGLLSVQANKPAAAAATPRRTSTQHAPSRQQLPAARPGMSAGVTWHIWSNTSTQLCCQHNKISRITPPACSSIRTLLMLGQLADFTARVVPDSLLGLSAAVLLCRMPVPSPTPRPKRLLRMRRPRPRLKAKAAAEVSREGRCSAVAPPLSQPGWQPQPTLRRGTHLAGQGAGHITVASRLTHACVCTWPSAIETAH